MSWGSNYSIYLPTPPPSLAAWPQLQKLYEITEPKTISLHDYTWTCTILFALMITMIMIHTLCCLAAVQNGTTELMDIGRGAMSISKLKFLQGFQALAYRRKHKRFKKQLTQTMEWSIIILHKPDLQYTLRLNHRSRKHKKTILYCTEDM